MCTCILIISGIFGILGEKCTNRDMSSLSTHPKDESLFIMLLSCIVILVQICCLFLSLCLSVLLVVALIKIENHTNLQTQNVKLGKVARHLLMVIFTNISCWIPSNIVLFLPLIGYQVSNQILSWITLIVIPINSILDPIIFTSLSSEVIEKIAKLWNVSSQKLTSLK